LETLRILAVFTAGSAAGLVSLSHLLGYVLNHYKHITTAVILGFITGSLGVVWPWKKTIYMTNATGNPVLDSNGDKIIVNYQRYLPEMEHAETWWAILLVIAGILVLLGIDWYGKNRRQSA